MDLLQHEVREGEAPEVKRASNVTMLFPADPLRKRPEPKATPEELAEYRRIRPQLLQMLAEWEVVKGSHGCPVLGHILGE